MEQNRNAKIKLENVFRYFIHAAKMPDNDFDMN